MVALKSHQNQIPLLKAISCVHSKNLPPRDNSSEHSQYMVCCNYSDLVSELCISFICALQSLYYYQLESCQKLVTGNKSYSEMNLFLNCFGFLKFRRQQPSGSGDRSKTYRLTVWYMYIIVCIMLSHQKVLKTGLEFNSRPLLLHV